MGLHVLEYYQCSIHTCLLLLEWVVYEIVMSDVVSVLLLAHCTFQYDTFVLVYKGCGYMDIVNTASEKCMQEAVEEVKLLPEYSSKGEVRYLSLRLHC